MKIQIHAQQFDLDEKLKDHVQKRVLKLEQYFDKIIDCEVFLRLENQGAQIKDKTAHIKVNIPGDTLFAEETSKIFEESIDQAADSLRRQIKRYKEKIRN